MEAQLQQCPEQSKKPTWVPAPAWHPYFAPKTDGWDAMNHAEEILALASPASRRQLLL